MTEPAKKSDASTRDVSWSHALWRRCFWLWLLVSALMVYALARDALRAPQDVVAHAAPSCRYAYLPWMHQPIILGSRRADEWCGYVLVGSLLLALLSYFLPRRREKRSLLLISIIVMAVVAGVLGLATYWPVAGRDPVLLAPASWMLSLFLGVVETSKICAAGAEPPVALDVARLFGIVATGSSVIAAAASTWRGQWERLRVQFASDVDVVIGLDAATANLTRALVQEARVRQERWHSFDWTKAHDLRGLVRRERTVVLVTTDDDHPLSTQVRDDGAILVVGDPSDEKLLRRLMLRRLLRPTVAIRRMFIMERDANANLALHATVERILGGPGIRSSRMHIIPRIVVRLDDSRDARDWRSAHLGNASPIFDRQAVTWFCDAVSADEVTAHELVNVLTTDVTLSSCERLVIVGDAPLTMALLDEVSWARWCRFDELRAAALYPWFELVEQGSRLHSATPRGAGSPEESWLDRFRPEVANVFTPLWRSLQTFSAGEPVELPESLGGWAALPLREIVLVGPAAEQIAQEWNRTKAPWSRQEPDTDGEQPGPHRWWLNELPVVPQSCSVFEVESQVAQLLDGASGPTMVVVVEPDPRYLNLARRLARKSPTHRVFLPDSEVEGLGDRSLPGSVARYGSSWLIAGRPLQDSWTVQARQQHAAWMRFADSEASAKGMAPPGVVPSTDARRVTGRPWGLVPGPGQLPEFFREDNLRQLREILWTIQSRGYKWSRPACRREWDLIPQGDLWATVVREHERWLALRSAMGWCWAESRDDARRLSPRCREWSVVAGGAPEWDDDRIYDAMLVQMILRRLHAAGLAPELPRFRRSGEVRARQVETVESWVTAGGDELRVGSGDWMVVDATGVERGVADDRFFELYEPVADPTAPDDSMRRFRRRGDVAARQVNAREVVITREGPATAEAGDWVVDDGSSQWPVPRAEFDRGYVPITFDGAWSLDH